MRKLGTTMLAVITVLSAAACAGVTHNGPDGTARNRSPVTNSSATSGVDAQATTAAATGGGHVVVVVMENHSYPEIIGSSQAPYINSLARRGKSLTRMFAITHPSQPNYIALFSGSIHGVADDSCPQQFGSANLGSELRAAHRSFDGYSQGLPRTGSRVCSAGAYARRHNPWSDFTTLPWWVNKPMSAFPTSFANLPTVAFVVPDVNHDMHDGTIRQGDTWLHDHLGAYANWAPSHGSLLIVTWDEDDRSATNRIPTVIVGAGVRAGRVSTHVTLYSLLRLIEDRYRLHRLGATARATAIPLG